MTTIRTQTAFDRFLDQTRALFAKEPDPEKRWTQLSPILADLLADPDVVTAAQRWPLCRFVDNHIQNLNFYEDPDYQFVVNALVTDPVGYGNQTETPVHDHGSIYTLYGLLDGHQRIFRYERLDDGTKPGFAEIRKTVDSACGPGEIDLVRPFEIHAEDQLGERTVAVIIRSARSDTTIQGHYQPQTNSVEHRQAVVQVPTSFY